MYTFLITFPNIFETKRFLEDDTYAKWFRRNGIQYNSRHISIRSSIALTIPLNSFIEDSPTTIVVCKESHKGKVKYTRLSKEKQ